jgi:hypothetical protein
VSQVVSQVDIQVDPQLIYKLKSMWSYVLLYFSIKSLFFLTN